MVCTKKKAIIKILAVVLIVVIISLVIMYVIPIPLNFKLNEIASVKSNVVYVNNNEEIPYLYKADSNENFTGEDFKIISFTDTHIDSLLKNRKKNMKTLEMIKRNIEEERPDLVIFTGDIITGIFTRNRATMFAEMMEKLEVHWAPVLGNHDSEHFTSISREELVTLWAGYDYCLIQKGDTEGYGNYIVNIKTSENTVSQSLIFMDSGSYMSKADIKKFNLSKKQTQYDYIKPAQIKWYRDNLNDLKLTYGNDLQSMLFMHIPLPEYINAFEEGEVVYGDRREAVCASRHNSGMFDAVLELASTQAIFAGHDHVNDYEAIYQGVHFIYVQASGYATYDMVSKFNVAEEDRMQGCTIINIYQDSSFSIERRLNTRF